MAQAGRFPAAAGFRQAIMLALVMAQEFDLKLFG
jgi:hypothetical protein